MDNGEKSNKNSKLLASMRKIILTIMPMIAATSLVSCGGSTSSIEQGYAYKISQPQAEKILSDIMHTHASRVSVKTSPDGSIEAKGHDRSVIDTQFYTLSAIPVTEHDAYGFKISHGGTLFQGPMTAKRIYDHAQYEASKLSTRIPIR
mgnify:CR=1 FL=1